MNDCATPKIRFETPTPLTLEAAFGGGRLTSDGGLGWLARMDSEMGLCEAVSECVPEWRPLLATRFRPSSSSASSR
jgi:hypothetical protein